MTRQSNTGRSRKTRAGFDETFLQLKAILDPYSVELDVTSNTDKMFALYTQHVMRNKQRLCFGAVRKNKSYVSFYLMPIYTSPELLDTISAGLRKRLQGKSCFNFKGTLDDEIAVELCSLTQRGYEKFNDLEFIEELIGQR